LLVGWLLAVAGLLLAARRRTSWTGPLLLLSGVAWFVPNFAHAWSGWLSIVAARSTYLHRGLVLAAIVAFPSGRTRSLRSAVVTDLVVGLGGARSGSLRDRLAAVLGDPSLEVGYWIAEQQRYVDASGRPIVVADGSGRATTRIEAGDATVAVLVHDPGVLEDA